MENRIRVRAWFRPVFGLGSLGTLAFGVGWLFGQQMPPALAQTPPPAQTAPAAPEANPDYSKRVVAYIYGNTEITREELGEYLIARYGTEKIELLINKKIIEHACKDRGIDVSAAEVDADIDNTINGLGGVDRKTFIEKVLSARHLSLYEWREDVVRPRLLLTKLCRDRVKIEDKDLQEAFEMHYEKIDAQVIIYPTGTQSHELAKVYDKIRSSAEEFEREARQQADSNLARTAGHIKPISRHTCPQLEQAAFRLKPGEISEMIDTPEGIVVIKCVARIPAVKEKSIDKEREVLSKEVVEKKVAQMIPSIFKELLAEAKPNSLMTTSKTEAELKRWTEQELKPNGKGGATPPLGH